jgi:hypothetical protein
MIDDNNRKAVKKGLKIKLPIGESREIGRPQAIIMGSDIRVRNSCTIINCTALCLIACQLNIFIPLIL